LGEHALQGRVSSGAVLPLFYRIEGRHNKKITIVAVAHKIKEVYRELGGDYFDRWNPETVRRMIIRMAQMGFVVAITQGPAVFPVVEEPAKRKRGRPRRYPLPESLSPEASTS
jgi:hypothetical protein